MQLMIRRTQRDAGLVSKNVMFCLNARVELTAEERANLTRYKLYNQVIYNSESAQRSREKSEQAFASGTTGGYLKSMVHMAITAMKLNITIRSLEQGQYIECKSMDELLAAEDALYDACRALRNYLEIAATFDGREMLVDFSSEEPAVLAVSSTPDPRLMAPAQLPPASLSLPSPTLAGPVLELQPQQSLSYQGQQSEQAWQPEPAYDDGSAATIPFLETPEGKLTVGGLLFAFVLLCFAMVAF